MSATLVRSASRALVSESKGQGIKFIRLSISSGIYTSYVHKGHPAYPVGTALAQNPRISESSPKSIPIFPLETPGMYTLHNSYRE